MGWVSFYDQTITVGGSATTGAIPFIIGGLTGKRIVFEVSNPAALDTWKTAFNLTFSQDLADFPEADNTSAANFSLTTPAALPSVPSTVNCDTSGVLTFQPVTAAAKFYRTTFTNASLSTGVLTLAHALAVTPVVVQIYDGSGKQLFPDDITLTNANSAAIDLTSYGTLTGTYSAIVVG